jgi:glycosyltransferase involved in cell wall biosynthesis
MKKVLMIAYNYPPIGGVGIIRTLKFSKYLSEYGWKPYVLTVKNRDLFYTTCGNDQVPDGVDVFRSRNYLNNLSIIEGGLRRLGVTSKIIVPDAFRGWIHDSVRMGKKIIEEEGIDLIYVSCPPHSSAMIGAKLKEMTEVPFVLDLRDAWTLNPHSTKYQFKYLQKIDEKNEKYIIESADYILTATEGIMNDYIRKYPSIHLKTGFCPNGFDLDDIPYSTAPLTKFTITYTGFFYIDRSPEPLFKALRVILDKKLIHESDIQFLWAGRDSQFVHDLVIKYDLESVMCYLGLVTKKQADELLYKSQLLYFMMGSTDTISQKTVMTGKIFPYLASGKPILAVVPDGAAKELIEEYSDKSITIGASDVDRAVEFILVSYRQWKEGNDVAVISEKTEAFRQKYNYELLAGKVAEVFDEIVSFRPT